MTTTTRPRPQRARRASRAVAPTRDAKLPFRGRLDERHALDRLLGAARGGQHAVLVVTGEAGVGKTALLEYAARQASGFRVVRLAGAEAEMELAYAALHQLCAPFPDHLGRLPAPQRAALSVALGLAGGPPPDRFLVALAALGLLSGVAGERPLLCLVDDADWLDDASAQVLGFVARRLAADSVALLFGLRGESSTPALHGLPELRLVGLDARDAHALLASVIPGRLDERVRDRIVAETRGNPLALRELSQSSGVAQLAGGFAVPDAVDVPARIEEQYSRRIARLPEPTRRLLLLASADAVGDPALVRRAATELGIPDDAAEPAQLHGLLEIDGHVRFRHPLVRSAVYGAAPSARRREAHAALAAATDSALDPDRRCWHRAHATTPPDETLAGELVDCAQGAERRGGTAAAAAFLERAVVFTPDPALRAERAVAAAGAKFEAGDVTATEALVATAATGPLDELAQAQLDVIRARVARAAGRAGEAPALLVHAASRLERLDGELARQTHLEALGAALRLGGLAGDVDAEAVALAARSSDAVAADPRPARKVITLALAARLVDGCAQAAPLMAEALRASLDEERPHDRAGAASALVAIELWDDRAWLELATGEAALARATGALALLPETLELVAGHHVEAGRLSCLDELLAESDVLRAGTPDRPLSAVPLRVAALRGQEEAAAGLYDELAGRARDRAEGAVLCAADHALAVLYNGLGEHERALEPARRAAEADVIAVSSRALCELVEAAQRSGHPQAAREAADQLSERIGGSGTAWSRGVEAHARALVAESDAADALYREALDWLGRCTTAPQLARAHLAYGQWLRGERRRADARTQLRRAHELFAEIGAEGFAARARSELLAAGERIRERGDETPDELSHQEERIARLARDGRTNPEIGAELFLSPRTVEWHLRKVFSKLGIRSRQELPTALSDPSHPGGPS